jgi:hypothetical protein
MNTKPIRTTRDIAVALATPAVRTVVIHAWHNSDTDDTGFELLPVLAVRSVIRKHFSNPDPGACEDRYTERELLDHGWRLDSQYSRDALLVIDREYGLISHEELDLADYGFAACEPAACPWPEAEDAERLKDRIADVRQQALERGRRYERRKQKVED